MRRVLESNSDAAAIWDQPIDGVVYIEPASRFQLMPRLIKGSRPERIKNLDDIPSPYLSGLFDKFFDGRLRPFLETNRGCPFRCSFCHTGNAYFQKTHMFSIERVREEINFIAPRMQHLGITGLHIADTNFGMYPRDREICMSLKNAHDTHGWPKQVIATTGKNNKERVIEITGIMGSTFNVNMSVQSMDPIVLRNINRDNIKLDDYVGINKHLKELGRPGFGELILGLPGETKSSFMQGIRQVVEAGVSATTIYTLMLLHGTDFQKPAYRNLHEIVGKFRIVPLNFGTYAGKKVFDYEEVCVQTKDLPFTDYKYLRGVSLLVETLHNGRPFEELFRYALSMGTHRSDFLFELYESLSQAPKSIQDIVENFLYETENELWDNEEQLLDFYREDENYSKLANGDAGGNLIQKYKSLGLSTAADDWAQFIVSICLKKALHLFGEGVIFDEAKAEVEALEKFSRLKLDGLLSPDGNTKTNMLETHWDIASWLLDDEGKNLSEFKTVEPVKFTFYYTKEQLIERDEYFSRYGTSVNALSKIVTRISSLESAIRKIGTDAGEKSVYVGVDRELSTRYAMST